jgi:hypothetical protein
MNTYHLCLSAPLANVDAQLAQHTQNAVWLEHPLTGFDGGLKVLISRQSEGTYKLQTMMAEQFVRHFVRILLDAEPVETRSRIVMFSKEIGRGVIGGAVRSSDGAAN